MNIIRIRYTIILAGISIIAVIGVQLYWVNNAYRLSENQFNQKVEQILSKTVAQTNDHLTCFELFSKEDIKPHEGFYMIKQLWDENGKFVSPERGKLDTVTMFYSHPDKTHSFSSNDLMFSNPVTAEVILKFRYRFNDSAESSNKNTLLREKITTNNFKDIISGNQSVYKQYDIPFMDSLLHKYFKEENIDNSFYYGIIRSDNDSVVYISPHGPKKEIAESKLQVVLNKDNYFSKPYRLAVYFEDKNIIVLTSLRNTLLSSVLIIVILSFAFWSFLKIIFTQKKLSEIKNDFIDNMTHEFNTPIANISLSVETIAEGDELVSPKIKKIIGIIGVENERLKENVERVLNIATIEKENFELVPVSIEINDLIKKVISNFEFRLNNYNAQINFEGLAGEFFMTADETHLTNVFHNLIDNALKYGKENTIINISLKLLSNKLFISIRDNGIGIGKEEQKKIFDKFYRVQNGNLHNVKGFGLGLSYVKSIIAEHKWTIEVKSELGKGTCFEIYLPINFSK